MPVKASSKRSTPRWDEPRDFAMAADVLFPCEIEVKTSSSTAALRANAVRAAQRSLTIFIGVTGAFGIFSSLLLSTFKFSFAFFQERAHSFGLIFAAEGQAKEIGFTIETFPQIGARCRFHGFFRHLQRNRTLLRNSNGGRADTILQLCCRKDFVHQADCFCLCCVNQVS